MSGVQATPNPYRRHTGITYGDISGVGGTVESREVILVAKYIIAGVGRLVGMKQGRMGGRYTWHARKW
nr:hypothetical protein GCM10010200_035610 [Actinomadura rugatobispora]